jgi:hypothetical protein
MALPPNVQARVDELVAIAPPLSPAQQRLIQRLLGPRPDIAAAPPQAA